MLRTTKQTFGWARNAIKRDSPGHERVVLRIYRLKRLNMKHIAMSTSIKVTVIGLVDVILDLYYCALLYCTLTKAILFYSILDISETQN